MLQLLALPLLGLTTSALGATIAVGGGLASATGGIVGGVASAAGGMLGGGGSGNVARDDDGDSGFERVSLGASPFGGGATGRVSGGAGLPAVVPQTSLVASDTISDGGSSPQTIAELYLSMFQSIQSSLISIDNTLKQMLGLQTNALAMENKSNTVEAFARAEGDKKNKEEKGFLGKTADRVGGIFNKAPNLFKILGLTALIASFKFFRTEIEGFIASVLKNSAGGFTSMKAFFTDTILPNIEDFFDFVIASARTMIGLKNRGDVDAGGETVSTTGSGVVDTALNIVSTDRNEFFDKGLKDTIRLRANNESDERRREKGEKVSFGDSTSTQITALKNITQATRGKVTWTEDLDDLGTPSEKRANASPVVNGKIITIEQLANIDLSKVPSVNYTEVNSNPFKQIETKEGSYENLTLNDEIGKIRDKIRIDLDAIKNNNDRYGFANVFSREERILDNQQILKDMGENVIDYKNADTDVYNINAVISGNSKKLNAAMTEAGNIKSYARDGTFNYIDNKQVDQSKVKIDKHGDRAVGFTTESDADRYVKNLQFYGF